MMFVNLLRAKLPAVQRPSRALNGKLLAALLEPHGAKAQLARYLEVDQGQITRWIDGDTSPGAEHLLGMAEFFDVSPWYLFGVKEPPEQRIATMLRSLEPEEGARMIRQFEALLSTATERYQPLMPGAELPPELTPGTPEFRAEAARRHRRKVDEERAAKEAQAASRPQKRTRPRSR